MIVFNEFGRMGNLGNQLFQLASLCGLAKRYRTVFAIPEWKYAPYFAQSQIQYRDKVNTPVKVKEQHYHYNVEQFDKYRDEFENSLVDLKGWLQSEKYWFDQIQEVKEMFHFKDSFIVPLMDKYQKLYDRPTIAISVRRGDYVDNPNYETLPITYYLGALNTFSHMINECNILIFSDDMEWCRVHFSPIPNTYFMEGDAITQLALMAQCDHFIISNSTFAWWGAYLGEKQGHIVVRPKYMFDGPLSIKSRAIDHWPERWRVYDHKDENGKPKKFPLTNVTFTIPVKFDHPDRTMNLVTNLKILTKYFDTNIIVGEQGGKSFLWTKEFGKYVQFPDMKEFHRTKMLNDMALMAETPYIVNWDADVFLPPAAILLAYGQLTENNADGVYPYDGKFARVPRTYYDVLNERLDVGWLNEKFKMTDRFDGTKDGDLSSVGGAIFWKKESFLDGGMENEFFISYGPEDVERYERFSRLGYKITRVPGTIYHLDHYKGKDSSSKAKHFEANHEILERIQKMNNDQLRDYVKGFPWRIVYSDDYREDIVYGSKRSAIALSTILANYMNTPNIKVLDVGCGLGSWSAITKPDYYYGIDYRIPLDKLICRPENVLQYDLSKHDNDVFVLPTNWPTRFDLAMCLEVAEHLPEAVSDKLVRSLRNAAYFVLFSAAIPGQSGVNHINEQWQSYWGAKFKKEGYVPVDLDDIRKLMWKLKDHIEVWYRQNIVLYAYKGFCNSNNEVTDYVDPEMFTNIVNHLKR